MWPDASGNFLSDFAVGPQNDGTFVSPVQAPAPVDAGGGPSGNYGSAILDVFKYGVGMAANYANNAQMLDYKRWEATNAGVAQQGQPAAVAVSGSASMSPGTLLLLALGAAFLIARS